MTLDNQEFSAQEPTENAGKKPYIAPELIVHGAVEKLTETTNRGNQNDGSIGGTRSA
jgi:hypothetical protein